MNKEAAETVAKNAELNRFELALDGEIAFLQYSLDGNCLSLDHTAFPSACEARAQELPWCAQLWPKRNIGAGVSLHDAHLLVRS